MNKETLKKHHFWFLFGAVPLLTLIAVLVLNGGVGGAIEKKKAEIKAANSALDGKRDPKPVKLIEKVEQQNKYLDGRKGTLWEANWKNQKAEFTWPNSPLLKDFEKADYKFGDPLPDERAQYDELRKLNVYWTEFENKNKTGMADIVAPTQFHNGWRAVLRHVASPDAWGQRKLYSDAVWLAMEDIWVQRALMTSIKSVNDQIAAFQLAPPDKGEIKADDKLRRRFVSRNWEVELWTETVQGKTRMRGKLTNTTDRLQLLGIGNIMTLRVWLDDVAKKPNAPYFDFRISTEFLPGKGALREVKDEKGVVTGQVPANVLDITPTTDHDIPPTTAIAEIGKVVQVFDARTVPVKRIDRVVLSYLDSRNATATLKKTKSMADFDEKQAAQVSSSGGGGGGSGGGPPPGMSMAGGRGSGGGTGSSDGGGTSSSANTATGRKEGAGTIEDVIDANRARYLDVSDNVRRMPVGLVLVVDQAYLQDVLLAYANSSLRFQITQVHWTRFRGQLGGLGTTGPGGSSDSGGGIIGSGSGLTGGGFEGAAGGTMSAAGGPPRGMSMPGGSAGGPPGTPPRGAIGGGGPPPGMSMPGGPPPGGSGSLGAPGGYGGGMMTTVSEAQLTSGLIEVAIYGVISLYEKFDDRKPEDKKDPAPAANTGPPPKDPNAPPVKVEKDAKDGKEPKGATPPDAKTTTPPDAKDPKGDAPKPADDAKKAKEPAAPPTDPKGKPAG